MIKTPNYSGFLKTFVPKGGDKIAFKYGISPPN
jgi:hypothetical protein